MADFTVVVRTAGIIGWGLVILAGRPMGSYHFVMLLTVMVIATANTDTASKESELTASEGATHQLDIVTSTQRLLRAYTPDKEDEVTEERGISKLPRLDKILNVLKSSKSKQLK
ncbi:unnamed protein product [Phytophthora lilii]|uniref:RxLR effector protein n=1 Tax=Phytophthora lilii TaxID=2077276 RepID=A0A9W6WVC5_9STRA|nr:unnamed protein product [Phytophthora lilii]